MLVRSVFLFLLLKSSTAVFNGTDRSPKITGRAGCAPKKFTTESFASDGTACITECDGNTCMTEKVECDYCTPGTKPAYTYYTAQVRNSGTAHCFSKCGYFQTEEAWCYVNEVYDWDFCNPETERRIQLRSFTVNNKPCKDKCEYHSESYLWCHPYSGSWNYCKAEEFYYDQVKTDFGRECMGICEKPDKNHFYSCTDDDGHDHQHCAPTAVNYRICPRATCKQARLNRSGGKPNETVSDYADRMRRDPLTQTVQLCIASNPIQSYTYRTTASGIRLPLVVTARIEPHHIQPANSRGNDAISYGAKKNCDAMGMNKNRPDENNDYYGHLIAYKNGGPPDWYNFAPQTQRINIGTTGRNSDYYAPSIWTITERTITDWAFREGGTVEFTVVVVYDPQSTRPIGFGTSETYYRRDGSVNNVCLNYWYSNDPTEDPDCWNE